MKFDLLLVGGGLQGALVALAVLDRDPSARLGVVERGARLAGNHTWSFHAGDLPAGLARAVDPVVVHRWPAYDVLFPGLVRRVERPYATFTSTRVDEVLRDRLGRAANARLWLGAAAEEVGADAVRLAGGERIRARWVLDARGPARPAGRDVAWQKFVGFELALARPLSRHLPLVMDARVPQEGGFRFMYVLPLEPGRALVEDTAYADGPELDAEASHARACAWVEAAGGTVAAVLRTEAAALPLPLAPVRAHAGPSPVRGGYGGGWFHATTGYSLGAAARLAACVAEAWPDPPAAAALRALAAEQARQNRFFALLNRLLFRATAPGERWRVLERFHRLPVETLERFYAARLRALDRGRILLGRPPPGVSLRAAVRELARAGGPT